jgi:hypothetical protein
MIGGSAYTIAETKVFKYLQVVHRGYVVSFGLAKFLPNVVEVDDFIYHVSERVVDACRPACNNHLYIVCIFNEFNHVVEVSIAS